MSKKIDFASIRSRVKDFRESTEIRTIEHGKLSAIVKSPVEAGMDRFIQVRDLPDDLSNLPFIAERQRDFAFRYGSEYKPIKAWAKTYGVHVVTIGKWLSHSGVRALIALTRYERRMYLMGAMLQIETRMYKAVSAILGTKITTDNMSSILSAAQFAWKIMNAPEDIGDREKGTFNQKIYIGGDGQDVVGAKNPYQTERDVTPNKDNIARLEAQVSEIKGVIEEAEKDE